MLSYNEMHVIIPIWENYRAKAALPLLFFTEGRNVLQTKERRAIQCMLHIRTQWGRMRRDYLRECHPGYYCSLLLSGGLWTYLADLDEQAQEQRGEPTSVC